MCSLLDEATLATSRIHVGISEVQTLHMRWDFFVSIPMSFLLISLTCTGVLSRFSHVRPFASLWTVTLQAPLSMGKWRLTRKWTVALWSVELGKLLDLPDLRHETLIKVVK